PHLSLDALAAECDFARIGRAPAHFDPDELLALNARTLHLTPYEAVASRVPGIDAVLWDAIRPNLTRLSDADGLALLVSGPLAPVIEDAALLAAATQALPPEPWDENTWPA